MIRTFIVDDHTLVRAGIKQILSTTPDIAVVAEAGDGDEALALLRTQPFDMLLLDMMLPGASGVELILSIRQQITLQPIHPRQRLPIKQFRGRIDRLVLNLRSVEAEGIVILKGDPPRIDPRMTRSTGGIVAVIGDSFF